MESPERSSIFNFPSKSRSAANEELEKKVRSTIFSLNLTPVVTLSESGKVSMKISKKEQDRLDRDSLARVIAIFSLMFVRSLIYGIGSLSLLKFVSNSFWF
jgi:hypothetical protein